jgi:HK97 family phage prohead protease
MILMHNTMDKEKIEKSNLEFSKNSDICLRKLETDTPDSRIVSGYAVKFDSESQYLDFGYIEIIRRGAITEDVIMNSDIFARFNHDEKTVLARSRYGVGSLALELRDDGLYYEFESPHTIEGDALLEHLKRGEITTSSFCFSLPTDGSGEKWTKRDDGIFVREILKINKLYDVSPVYEPAYLSTSCCTRAAEIFKQSNEINSKYDAMLKELDNYKI